jgi:hypothetical protein
MVGDRAAISGARFLVNRAKAIRHHLIFSLIFVISTKGENIGK